MTIKRVKATMGTVQKEISPYVQKHVFGRDTIDTNDIQRIASLLLGQYNNVSISQGLGRGKDGKPWLKITVKSFPFNEDKVLEVTGIPYRKEKKKRGDLDWIDRIEEFETFMDD
ncbi:MAG: hypothetical protein LIP12_01165 [Clostridiales bacterium]|nr:hypothetical protein [Clostridiales bacterium]